MSPQNICKSKMFPQNLIKFPTNLMFSIIYFLLSFLCFLCSCVFPTNRFGNGGKGSVVGLLKVGHKKLFLLDEVRKYFHQSGMLYKLKLARLASRMNWCHFAYSTSMWPSAANARAAEANFSNKCSSTSEQIPGEYKC